LTPQTIGVLAVQGGFRAHVRALEQIGHRAIEVRTPKEMECVDGLVLPGGESTAQLKLIGELDLERSLRRLVSQKRPVFATCAGLILIAQDVCSPVQPSFGFLDVGVTRNAFGTQLDSFEGLADGLDNPLPLVFIRAPRIHRVGPGVEVLARYKGEPILVRQGIVTAATFHPELGTDRRVHRMVFG
jgi:5'-phosphate synthase pdxT subunit